MSYSNVVVGTDGSSTAELAVRHASELAKEHGARLVIVTAFEAHRTGTAEVDDADRVPTELRWMLTDRSQAEEKARHGKAIAAEVGAPRVTVQAIQGSPGDVLLEAAKDFGADCIIVGSRGLASHAHLLMGSVASTVAHHAPCDVLIVHTTR